MTKLFETKIKKIIPNNIKGKVIIRAEIIYVPKNHKKCFHPSMPIKSCLKKAFFPFLWLRSKKHPSKAASAQC